MRTRTATLLASLLLIAVSATAQNGGGTGGGVPMPMPVPAAGVTGFVTTVSGNLITVLNGNVTIDATGAKFSARKGDATIADVKPGLQIIAMIRNAQAAPGTMLQAASVMILDLPAGSLNGPVQSIDLTGSALTVLGARVRVTAETKIYTWKGGRAGALSDIKVGDTAIIELSLNGSALVAESIQVVPPIPNVGFEGTVKSIGASSWIITAKDGDVTVNVTPETKIDPNVKIGDRVYVVGNADAAGVITAVAIYAARPTPPPTTNPSLQGKVKSIGTASWVITTDDGHDVTVIVNANTKIEPGIAVGDSVMVVITKDEGNYIAVAIMKSPNKRRSSAH